MEENWTPSPWTTDGNFVLCHDHPIAEITRGVWGDQYPSLRFKEGHEGSISPASVEAYMDIIAYGEVPAEEALANARLISAAPDIYTALDNLVSEIAVLRIVLTKAGTEHILDGLEPEIDAANRALMKAEGDDQDGQ